MTLKNYIYSVNEYEVLVLHFFQNTKERTYINISMITTLSRTTVGDLQGNVATLTRSATIHMSRLCA